MVPDASNTTALAEYYTIHAIPQKFNPGIICASVLVAFLGAWSALLLLGKRTSNRGLRNIILLLMAAVVQSAVGIWSMHFVGMHMTLVPAPGIHWYVSFNPGFTVLSLFVPLIALAIAFFFLDMSVFTAWRACVSGVLTGGTIGLMHYSASFHSNLNVSYQPAQTVVSIVIAMIAATVALTLFFQFKSHWNDAWWKRVICAGVLAVSVAGMHYIGVWGTSYTLRSNQINDMSLLENSNNTTAIIICVMCVVVFLLSVAVGVTDLIVAKAERQAARKVVVCSLTFNKPGQLLVREDGTLPMVMIETPLHQTEVIDALDKRQPTFQWLYAVSWDWRMVSNFVSAIGARLRPMAGRENDVNASALKGRRMRAMKRLFGRGNTEDGDKSPSPNANAQVKLADFRDRVIDAATSLAEELDVPFHEIGVLYDTVMQTGTRPARVNKSLLTKMSSAGDRSRRSSKTKTPTDEEASIAGRSSAPPSIFGEEGRTQEGAMLFLVRELNRKSQTETEERYLQRGYRLTETRFLAGHLADRYAAQKEEMDATLTGLKMYAKRGIRPVVQPNGVYVGLFGVRPSTTRFGGLETLVYEFARHQIPAYRLPKVESLTPQVRYFLTLLNEMTLEDAMTSCETEASRSSERLKSLTVLRSSREISRNRVSEEIDEADEIRKEADNLNNLIAFQNALLIALEALSNSLSVYPKLKSSARLSSDVLQVPSSLDDSTDPAEMILVRAVLPDGHNTVEVDPTQLVPSDEPQKGTPFVYTPYTLFTKSQMMLLKGRQAEDFEQEVLREMNRRYPPPSQTFGAAKDYESSLLSFDKVTSPLSVKDGALSPDDSTESDGPYSAPKLFKGKNFLPFKMSGSDSQRSGQRDESNEMQERKTTASGRPLSTIPESPQINALAGGFASRAHARRSRTPSVPSHHSSVDITSSPPPPHQQETLTSLPHSPNRRPSSSGSAGVVRQGTTGSGRLRYATSPDLSRRVAEDAASANTSAGIRRFLETKTTPLRSALVTPRVDESDELRAASQGVDASGPVAGDIDAVAYLSGPHALPYPFMLKTEGGDASALHHGRPQTAPEHAEPLDADLTSSPREGQRTTTSVDVMPDYARLYRPRPSTVGEGVDRRVFMSLASRHQQGEDTRAGASALVPASSAAMEPTLSENASAAARYKSDGWVDRHLHAVEKGPGGQSLLGVDY